MSLLNTANHPPHGCVLKPTMRRKKCYRYLRSFFNLLSEIKLHRILRPWKTYRNVNLEKWTLPTPTALQIEPSTTEIFISTPQFIREKNGLWSGHVIRCISINNPMIFKNSMGQKSSAFIAFTKYQSINRIGRSILRWIRESGLSWNGNGCYLIETKQSNKF